MTDDFDKLFDAQLKRELQMNDMGKRDLLKATKQSEEQHYASHTMYGSWVRREYTLRISKVLKEKFREIRRGKAMQGASALVFLHEHLDWDRVSYIALSTMLDMAGIPKYYNRLTSSSRSEKGLLTIAELDLALGKRIMIESNLQTLRKSFRHKYQEYKELCFTDHASFTQKITNMKRKVRGLSGFFQRIACGEIDGTISADKAQDLSEGFNWTDWSSEVQAQVGSHIARVVNDVTGFFAYTRSFDEKGKTQNLFVFSEVLNDIRDSIMRQSEGYAFFMLPMLVPPKKWTTDSLGGYQFSAKVVSRSIVRGWRQETDVSQTTLDFINAQQEVPFRLDPEMIRIQKFLADKGWSILGEAEKDDVSKDSWRPYRAPEPWDVPKLPEKYQGLAKLRGTMPEDEYQQLRQERKMATIEITRFHTRQKEKEQLGIGVARYLRVVQHIENDPCFFFPWNLDWRTRCYPMVDALNPQGPEYQKAALSFGNPTTVDDRTDYWLSAGIGGAAGLDKESFESRIAWTKSHLTHIRVVAEDPLGEGFSIWTNMPEPWIFLRSCLEYYRIFIAKTQDYTDICCLGQDATQSGLQLLGGMVRDKQTCDLVNCVPGHDKPVDAYGTVLAEAIRLIEEADPSFPVEKIRGKRKLVKTPVMTKVYAAGHDTRVNQIRQALMKEGIRFAQNSERNEEMIEYLTDKVEEAMVNTIPGVDIILDWFQKVSSAAYERGVQDLIYETPSGNRIVCEYREAITKQVQTESIGKGVCIPVKDKKQSDINKVRIAVDKGDPSPDDGIRAIAANFTHGAGDAALLQLAFHDAGDLNFVTTHDCVYAPPSRAVDEVHRRVREAFIKICQFGVLERFAVVNGVEDIPPPIVGTYNPTVVRRARFFFS
jgi:DNA-directed RNA polymerase